MTKLTKNIQNELSHQAYRGGGWGDNVLETRAILALYENFFQGGLSLVSVPDYIVLHKTEALYTLCRHTQIKLAMAHRASNFAHTRPSPITT